MSQLTKQHGLTGKRGNARTKADVEEKIIAALKEGYTQGSIAKEYGVSLSTVNRINRKLKQA